MNVKVKLSFLSLSFFTALSYQVNAEEERDFFDMSIEQLINIETNVASIRSESLADAPSVVTTFSREEISSLGVSELFDLMNFVPGFQSVKGEWISSHKKLQSRGVYLDSGYVLLMVDGVRLNEVSFGKASVYTPYIDLSNVEKVEVIRGPGSEIYGSNAFFGVVNVITRKTNSTSFELGSNSHKRFSANLFKPFEHGNLSINLSMLEGDGETQSIDLLNTTDVPEGYKNNQPYNHKQLTVAWGNEHYSLQYKADKHELDRFLNLNGYHPDNRFDSLNQYVTASFNHTFANHVTWKTNLDYSRHEIESAGFIQAGWITPFSEDFLNGPNWSTRSINIKSELSYDLSDSLRFKIGIEKLKGEQYQAGVLTTHISPDKTSDIPLDNYYLGSVQTFSNFKPSLISEVESTSLFGQVKWLLDERRALNFGGRYEKYKQLDDKFLPRISYIQKLNQQSQFKLIYSEAYRAPVTNELYSDDGVTLGNPELNAEHVSTIEAQYLYKQKNWSAEITGFHNSMDDLITSQPVDESGRTQFKNTDSAEVSGIELLAYYKLNEFAKLRTTFTSYLTSTIEESYENFVTIALLSSYNNLQFGVNTIYRPSVNVDDGFRISGEEIVFSESDIFLVNLNLAYQLGRSINFSANLSNVFDVKYHAYEPRQNLNDYQVLQQGRLVKFTLNYQF